MKRITCLVFFVFSYSVLLIAQTKTTKESKGDDFFFRYNYDEAIQLYQATTLTEQGHRNYAYALEKMSRTIEAEQQFSKLLKMTNNQNLEDLFHYTNLLKVNGKFDDYKVNMDIFSNLHPLDSRSISYQENIDNFTVLSMDDKLNKIKLLNMNTIHSDFGVSFWKDKIVYTSNQSSPQLFQNLDARTDQPFLNMYVADEKDEQLFDQRYFDRGMKDVTNDGPASFAKNGTFMAYTRNHLRDRSEDKIVELQIQFSTFENNKWSNPVPFEYNNSSYSVGHPFLTEAGDSMYFTSDMPGGFGGKDLYLSTWSNFGYWTNPVNLGNQINTESDEMFPFYDEQTKILYFTSDGHFGLGGLDIFYFLNGEVVNLGAPINSRQDDFAIALQKDGLTGYFSSNRSTGKGSDDLYRVHLSKKPKQELRITGAAFNDKNEHLSGVTIQLFNQRNELMQTLESKDGSYDFIVVTKEKYTLKGFREMYNEGTKQLEMKKQDTLIQANLILSETPITKEDKLPIVMFADLGKMIQLKSIYFDFDKSDIREDAIILLDEIVKIMNDYPNMEVSLRSYTDCRGSMEYNQYLSDLRAKASVEYIQNRININPSRISGKGYGESNPINECECQDPFVTNCTPKQHLQNRRTEFIVIKM